jgi:hypothetical protein
LYLEEMRKRALESMNRSRTERRKSREDETEDNRKRWEILQFSQNMSEL